MQTVDGEDDVLTVEEVAAWLRVSRHWVRAHANNSRRPFLPSMKMGKYIRFRRGAVRDSLTRWQREREQQHKT